MKKVKLTSFDEFGKSAFLDMENYILTDFCCQDSYDEVCGQYYIEHTHLYAMFYIDRTLYFLDEQRLVNLNGHVVAKLDQSSHIRTLTLTRGDLVLFKHVYKVPTIDPSLEIDPTPFVDEEDFDFFFLFITYWIIHKEKSCFAISDELQE